VFTCDFRWVGPDPSAAAVAGAEAYYSLLAKAPRIMNVMLHAVIGVGICGHLVKLWKANESNYLFDGASLVLYMIATVLYGTSVISGTSFLVFSCLVCGVILIVGIKSIETGEFGDLTKVDTLRVMAASHVILAVVLIGTPVKCLCLINRSITPTRRTVVR